MSNDIVIGGRGHTVREIQEIVAGYAFGTEAVSFDPQGRVPVGDAPTLAPVPRWGYRSYDCVPTTSGPLTELDMLVANGLNGQLDLSACLAVRAVAPAVDAALARIPVDLCFWQLGAGDVAAVPAPESDAWWIWRAWWLLIGTPGVGIALTHKILHHKHPSVFPLLDGKTRELLADRVPDMNAWQVIHSELGAAAGPFTGLERWFAELAVAEGGVPITRLRIHDIVLWCDAVGQAEVAQKAGAAFLAGVR